MQQLSVRAWLACVFAGVTCAVLDGQQVESSILVGLLALFDNM